jgi:hypothetical protein
MDEIEIIKNEVVELNEKIKARLEELGLEEFHFSNFYGDGECCWCDEELALDISFDDDFSIDFRYWTTELPIRYECICIDLRAIKIVGETILYCLEWYSDCNKGPFNEEAYFVEFEELLDMDYYSGEYKNVKSLLERILEDGLGEEDSYGLIETNKEYFR